MYIFIATDNTHILHDSRQLPAKHRSTRVVKKRKADMYTPNVSSA